MHSFIFGQETEWYFIHTVVELHVEHGVISNKVFEQYFFLQQGFEYTVTLNMSYY